MFLFAIEKTQLLLGTNTFFIKLSFSPFKRSFGKRKDKKLFTSFLYLPLPEKLSASFWIVKSALLAVFPKEQLKELREAELRDTIKEVDCEIFDETNSGFKQYLNSNFKF